ncbi:hypothetical protein LTR37_020516 [Vermiconidia calcicola]|uniref:Uncharacterized protein n=1 Tax=Vermiconidia calcicola TaxID=1690605 RepID=A0ACC3MCW0_9PEZI|nr:hypothetical protein LTR37_020516 [Vermiconidia calcicola]
MSAYSAQQDNAAPIAEKGSDYGSDVDDTTAYELLSQAESQPLRHVVLESIEEPLSQDDPARPHLDSVVSHMQQSLDGVRQSSFKTRSVTDGREVREASVEVEYDEGNRITFSPSRAPDEPQAPRATSIELDKNDTRSLLERFRTRPKKPLSVTDLVSPAWCEQQYEYSLTKYGRVRRTPAMKQGSSVHKELEEQVRGVEVVVETVSKEDRFGLQIWNAIEGLRILRETGLTRELQVWGVVEGEVVIGIIDEISTSCPDENMEAAILEDLRNPKSGSKRKNRKSDQLPSDQRTLTDFLTSSQNGSLLENNPAFLGTLQQDKPSSYYIKDIKTRQSRTLPGSGSPSRPTHMQLMLYHRLLSSLAANEVPAEKIFERYSLDQNAHFSDKFIAEIGNLNMGAYAPSADEDGGVPLETMQRQDPLTELLQHNTLALLWNLLMTEFARTLPTQGLNGPPISPLLTADFRTASAKGRRGDDVIEEAGTLIGQRSFPFESAVIDRYIRDEMAWWKGERETKGVEVEEAYKCRMCEFAEGCVWRKTKVEEGLRKAKLRSESRRKSEV